MIRTLFLVCLGFGLSSFLFSDPSADQQLVVKRYAGMTFSTAGLKAGKAQTNGWIPYAWTEGRTLWENAAQGYTAVVEPSGAEIYRYGPHEYEFHFANGRVIKDDPSTGKLTWNPMVGDPAPDFELPTLDGKSRVKLSNWKGQVVFLDFWASWCGPCQQALPGTEALHAKFQGRGLKVLGVNIEGDVVAAKKNAASLKLTFPSVMAQSGPEGANWSSVQIADYGINSIPRGVLIDKKGIIRAEDTVLEVAPLIEKLLAE